MRKFSCCALLLAAFGLMTAASSAQADDGFDLGDSMLGEGSDVDLGGWLQFGYTNNPTGLFNTDPHMLNLQQSWLYLEKVADGSNGVDIGGRVDVMYGTDGDNTQAFGNSPGEWDFMNGFDHGIYAWAIPQAYVDVAVGDLTVRAGHFYTLLGYEVVTAPDNFFYSHAFTMNFSEAFTHTGVLGIYEAGDNLTLYGGWTLGWDTGFDQFNDGSSFLGGASIGLGDNVTFTYITTFGNFGAIGDGYSHSMVFDVAISDDLNYIFQSDLIDTNADALGDGGTTFHTFGINQYLIYSINDEVGVGARMEWWKANGGSVYAFTAGMNFRPLPNLIIRPEWRYQWSPFYDQFAVVNNAFSFNEGIFGVDAILTF